MPSDSDTFFNTAGEQFGGTTENFQQGNPESYGWINLDPGTRHGACYALAGHWLNMVKKDQDFFSWVKRPSGIKAMNNLFCKSTAGGGGAAGQIKVMNKFMKDQGFKRMRDNDTVNKPVDPDQVAINLVQKMGYKSILIWGPGGGHAIAAVVQPNKALFYDPNYGQVGFKSYVNMAYWFKTWWSQNSFYKTKLGSACKVLEYV